MTAPVADTLACLEANERLLATTRHRLAVSRRILSHPGLKISGGSSEADTADARSAVRRIVRLLLTSGALWPIRGRVTWAGYGSGRACCVCGTPVRGSEVEYEVEDGSRQRPACHFACFVVWHEESRTFDGYDGETS